MPYTPRIRMLNQAITNCEHFLVAVSPVNLIPLFTQVGTDSRSQWQTAGEFSVCMETDSPLPCAGLLINDASAVYCLADGDARFHVQGVLLAAEYGRFDPDENWILQATADSTRQPDGGWCVTYTGGNVLKLCAR